MIYIAGQTLGGLTSIDRCSFPRQPLQVRLPVGQDDSTRVIKDFELSLGGQGKAFTHTHIFRGIQCVCVCVG